MSIDRGKLASQILAAGGSDDDFHTSFGAAADRRCQLSERIGEQGNSSEADIGVGVQQFALFLEGRGAYWPLQNLLRGSPSARTEDKGFTSAQ